MSYVMGGIVFCDHGEIMTECTSCRMEADQLLRALSVLSEIKGGRYESEQGDKV